jgi:hypothetical protein
MDSDGNLEPGNEDDLEEATAVFPSIRPRLFGIAYRMLGSASEAEDLVQEVWLRQLVSWARKHMASERHMPVSPAAQRKLLTTFIAAARTGDMTALEKLFAADVASVSDGNGMAGVSRRPITGVQRVAKFLHTISAWYWDGVDVQWANTNGQTSAVLRRGGTVLAVVTVSASADGIDQVLWMFNPDKITAVSAR